MKTAKEMFEELGFEKPKVLLFSERNGITCSWIKEEDKSGNKFLTILSFNSKSKELFLKHGYEQSYANNRFDFKPIKISFNLYHAINQQMKELGWLE